MVAHRNAALLALITMEITGLVRGWRCGGAAAGTNSRSCCYRSPVSSSSRAPRRSAARFDTLRSSRRARARVCARLARARPRGREFVLDNPWVWPICEVFHFVGLCLLFGVVLLVNLRQLGVVEGVALADVNRLLPWGIGGFGVNLVTGMLFFLASPDQYTQNPAFTWKMGLMLVARSACYTRRCVKDTSDARRCSMQPRRAESWRVLHRHLDRRDLLRTLPALTSAPSDSKRIAKPHVAPGHLPLISRVAGPDGALLDTITQKR